MQSDSSSEHYKNQIKETLEQIETWAAGRGQAVGSSLNLWSYQFDTTADQIPADQLQSFTKGGHRVEVKLDHSSWQATVVAEGGSLVFLGEPTGNVGNVFEREEQAQDAQSAIADREAKRLIKLFADNGLACTATCYLENDPSTSGFHWAMSVEALHHYLEKHTWCGLGIKLFETPDARRLVIEQAGDAVFQTQGLVVHGPETWPVPTDRFKPSEGSDYREKHFSEKLPKLPPPTGFQPLSPQQAHEKLAGIDSLFRHVSHALAWFWLGTEVTLTGTEVGVHFSGDRGLDVDLTKVCDQQTPTHEAVEQTLTLWRRVVEPPNSLLFEALQKAVVATVTKPSDLFTAAGPVLRTTLMLHRIAEQGAIAEAFGVRESARKATMEAARSIAESVRSTTRSVVDRVFAQLGISAGVMVAYQKDLIDATVVRWLLAVVVILLVATAIAAFGYEFPSAQRFKTAFVKDLDNYRDTLTPEDIDSIKQSTSLKTAQTQLWHSVLIAVLLIVGQAIVLVGIGYFLFYPEHTGAESAVVSSPLWFLGPD